MKITYIMTITKITNKQTYNPNLRKHKYLNHYTLKTSLSLSSHFSDLAFAIS